MFSAFSRGRDVVLHQSSVVNDSRVEVGLFKYLKVRLALQHDLRTDEPSHSLLARIVAQNAEQELVAPLDHPWVGEQLGVRRRYHEPTLSKELDVMTASDHAWRAVSALVEDAHNLHGLPVDDPADTQDVPRAGCSRQWQ